MSIVEISDDSTTPEIHVPVIGYRDGVAVWATMAKCRFDPRRIQRIRNIKPFDGIDPNHKSQIENGAQRP